MQNQVNKYLGKLINHGLVEGPGDAELYGLDDEIYSNRDQVPEKVRAVFDALNINSLLIALPEPVRWSIISELLRGNPDVISPTDSESLTFIHDIPVIGSFDPGAIACALNRRKGCIVKDRGIVSFGTVSLEQAFVVMSSICFATFVKYFTDIINGIHGFRGMPRPTSLQIDTCQEFLTRITPYKPSSPLSPIPPADEAGIIKAMDAAGKAMVHAHLVDSFFGNISLRLGDVIYISQTGSSLDELPGRIDRVPLDGSSTCEITSSSELSAHVKIYELSNDRAILHGHPRFSVIMSMFGEPFKFGETRHIGGIPVVAGEVGAGRKGLVHTLPQAMLKDHAAIVHGHGVFVGSAHTFHEAYEKVSSIETGCFELYKEALKSGA